MWKLFILVYACNFLKLGFRTDANGLDRNSVVKTTNCYYRRLEFHS